ncbi:MAG: redoxin domain-containing protein [Bradyrhizobium sp.]|nr:redoxin domain-containing protein [Bradyrhizobium sp.]
MSKKTRKKTTKASSGKVTRGGSVTSAKTAAKAGRVAANKSSKAKKSANAPGATPAASRKATAPKVKAGGQSASAAQRPKAAPPVGGKPALAEGAKAPGFHLPRDGGQAVSLADFSGRKLVLFFYPRADTPGCTKEAIDFTRLRGKFAESDTAVLGVSADPPKTQEAFRDKHQLSIPLVSDEQHEMLEAYGVWGEKSMYGRTFQGILRTTVLIGADGRIIKIWRNVKVDGHADEVLAAAHAA